MVYNDLYDKTFWGRESVFNCLDGPTVYASNYIDPLSIPLIMLNYVTFK